MYPCFMALRGRLREKAAPFLMKHLLCTQWGGDTSILLCENLAIWNTGGVFLSYRGGFT